MGKKTFVWLVAALLIGMIIIGGCTSMQTAKVPDTPKYPDRPITVIVPFSAGSGPDLIARLLEKAAMQHLGQPLVVVNKPGGAGSLGFNELVAAAPDGYTIGISSVELILNPLYGSSKYNYLSALEPLAQATSSISVLVIQANQPWNNVKDVIDYSETNSEKLKFGHQGIGSFSHIVGETFSVAAGSHLEQVPFRGGGETIAALLGGHIQIAFVSPAMAKEHLKNGTLRALAVSDNQRLNDPVFAQVPTFKEQGYDIVFNSWFGIASPKELPPQIKNKLAEGLKSIIATPEFQKSVEAMGYQLDFAGPKEATAKWQDDSKKLTKTVRDTGILELIKTQKQ